MHVPMRAFTHALAHVSSELVRNLTTMCPTRERRSYFGGSSKETCCKEESDESDGGGGSEYDYDLDTVGGDADATFGKCRRGPSHEIRNTQIMFSWHQHHAPPFQRHVQLKL